MLLYTQIIVDIDCSAYFQVSRQSLLDLVVTIWLQLTALGRPSLAVTSTRGFAFGTPGQTLPPVTSCFRGRSRRLTSRGVSRRITGLSISGPSSRRYGLSLISLLVNWMLHIARLSEDVVMHRLCRVPFQDG